jgi:hypothetical protein
VTLRGLHKVVRIADREIVVRELTVAELRQWIAEGAAGGDLLAEKLNKAPHSLLAAMSGLTVADLAELLPDSEIAQLEAAARECNPSFFGLLGLAEAAQPPA